jgi:hypothetical protein
MMFMMRFRSNEQSAAMHQNNFEDGIKAMRRVLLDDDTTIRSTVIQRNTSFSGLMADNLASFKVFCQGGLNTSRDVLSQGETQPGSAISLD